MIRAENLVKIYDSAHPETRALDGVSFILPSHGMVFVVGKSGSGKSTLMNILGGLDTPTSGEVYVDGVPMSDMTPEEADSFRESKIGFVFQDFLLFDKMSAEDNVRISLDIAGKTDDGAAREALARVDMDGFGERRPKQLSAGQKQRVAVARALVKNPKIILADEPTGNIDSENTVTVLELLKKQSSDALVIVISHSESDALRYADRIIRLAGGKIVSDTVRDEFYSDTLDLDADEALLPARPLTDAEVGRLNEAVAASDGRLRISQKKGGFVPVREQTDDRGAGEWKTSRMKPKAFLKYSAGIMKKSGVAKALVCIVTGLLLALLAVAQNFALFDKTELIATSVADAGDRGVVVRQGYYEETGNFRTFKDNVYISISEATQAELENIYGKEYYRMYSVQTTLKDEVSTHAIETGMIASSYSMFRYGYAVETNGVLVCDIDYLKRLFGDENGEVRLVAGEIPSEGGEILVTDYILDACVFHGVGDAETLFSTNYSNQRVDIAGVIYTGYKEKYAELLSMLAEGEIPDTAHKMLSDFVYDVNNYLSLCYTVNPNWKEDYLEDYIAWGGTGFAYFNEIEVSPAVGTEGKGYDCENRYLYYTDGIAADEAWMNFDVYNAMFGTSYTLETFEYADVAAENRVVTVKLTDRAGETLETRTFRITKLNRNSVLTVSRDYLYDDKAGSVQVYALYLTDTEAALDCLSEAEEMLFYPVGDEVSALMDIAAVADMLAELLTYIAVAVAALIVLMLLFNAFITVRGSVFEIGMFRALGATTAKVGGMFVLQTAVMCLVICVVGAVGCAVGAHIADGIVAEYVEDTYPVVTMDNISVAAYDGALMAADCAGAIAVVAASGLVPVLAVRRIKPVRIIRARE